MKNNPWKKFIIVVSALLIVIMVCVTTNLITNSITNSLRMQPLGGVQQQQGVVNGGGFAQNNGGQMGVTPDSNGSFGGDSSLGGNSADQGLTAAPQGGGSSDTQTSNDPLKMNKSQLINYRNHPVDNIPAMFENGIPVMLICGDSDTVVPYHENGKAVADYYEQNGGKITKIIKPGCDHHPHGLEDNAPIIKFALENY